MAELDIGGTTVTVDDSFLSLTPEQQGQAVQQIANELKIQPHTPVQTPQVEPQRANAAGKGDLPVGAIDVASDVVQSAGAGLRSGAESLVGLPGDLGELIRTIGGAGLDLLQENNVITPETRSKIETAGAIAGRASPGAALVSQGPTTQDVRNVTNAVVGEAREPETTAGEFARTIGEFAPAAAFGGGGLLARAGITTAAAVGSEAAGQATKDTEAEPYARLVGALAGGGGGVPLVRRFNKETRSALASIPTREELVKQTDELYGVLRDAKISFNQKAMSREIKTLKKALKADGVDSATGGKGFAHLKRLEKDLKDMDFATLERRRQNFARDLRGMNPGNSTDTERRTLSKAIQLIDNIYERVPAVSATGSKVSGEVARTVKLARSIAKRKIKSDRIEQALANAKDAADDDITAVPRELRKLIRGNRAQQWTKAERDAIRAAADGGFTRAQMRTLAKFGFSMNGNVALIPTLGAGLSIASGGGVALPVAGTAARFGSNIAARQGARNAGQFLRAAAPERAALGPRSDLSRVEDRVRSLLFAEAGARPLRSE